MRFEEARKIIVEKCYQLQPYCTKIHIAGSLRRGKPEVKDGEIVCLPKIETITDTDLFGGASTRTGIVSGYIEAVNSLGRIMKGKVGGRYMQIELKEGINLDLFTPEPADFYRQYAIRTGNAEYAHRVIAGGCLRKGWCGADVGLRKQSDCVRKGKDWKCVNPNAELPPVWESEKDFFKWLGVEWIEPKYRNY